jgi:hypothetical protein
MAALGSANLMIAINFGIQGCYQEETQDEEQFSRTDVLPSI